MNPDLIYQLSQALKQHPDAPSTKRLEDLCDLLYGASLLKEEGRPVRARVVVAPPSDFDMLAGPPSGTQVVVLATAYHLSANEIKRLSPAASFFHSAIAIWPDEHGKFRIWGLLNTGLRWMNVVAGGRKPDGQSIACPTIHVRDPGWLLFYNNHELLSEWRGQSFHKPGLDVFESRLMNERFADIRTDLIAAIGPDLLPATLDHDTYSQLIHRVALQFLRRVVNLMRSSGHGGTLVMIPMDEAGEEIIEKWIDCKYEIDCASVVERRVPALISKIIKRIGLLAPAGSTLEEAWETYRNSHDPDLDALEEGFFELARMYSDMMQVDGALILDHGLNLIGFGGEIRVGQNVIYVEQAHDLDGNTRTRWDIQSDGTRHRSMYRLCAVEPAVVGFVVSQDSALRLIVNVSDSVVFWVHSQS
jgi:hypothetical protein